MVKIRLLRVGARSKPFYRIVAIDERRQRDGRPLEFLGTWDPKRDPGVLQLDLEGLDRWQGRGAILSETVRSLARRARAEAASAPQAEGSAS